MLYTVPGVPRFGTRKTGEPLGSSPGDILANQIRTLVPPVSQVTPPRERIPSLSVIFSPGSKIGHTPRKNPSAPMGAAATSRINAYRGWCRTPVLHQPFAAKKYDTTIYRKLQVFFQQIVKYFLKNSAFCRNSLSRPFPAFSSLGVSSSTVVYYTRSCAKSKGRFTHILPGMVHFLLSWSCWDFWRRNVIFWSG